MFGQDDENIYGVDVVYDPSSGVVSTIDPLGETMFSVDVYGSIPDTVTPPDWVKDWVAQYNPGSAPSTGQSTADWIANILKIGAPVAVAAFQASHTNAVAQGRVATVTPGYKPSTTGTLSGLTAGLGGILPIALLSGVALLIVPYIFGRKKGKK